MSRTFISIDWGGSELKGVCLSVSGLAREFRFASGNLRVIDEESLREICLKLTNVVGGKSGQSNQWLIGAAGADDQAAAKRLKQILLHLDPQAEGVEIYSDYACNHAACLGGGDGILSINGTGSVIFGVFGNTAIRTSGWGYLLDETPSGSFFGRKATEGVLRHLEGEAGYEAFFQAYIHKNGEVDRRRIIDELYRSGGIQARLGSQARVLTEAFDAGNENARRMVDDSINKLAESLANLMKQCAVSSASACGSGGLWASWPIFTKLVDAACARHELAISWQKRSFNLIYGPLITFAKTEYEAANLLKTLKQLEQSND